jgi:exonuclease SbcD
MRFLHLSDLHLGKSIHGVSLLENGDQVVWAERFLMLCERVKPDAVLIAGDVYDRSAPSGDAMQLLSHMLTELAARNIPVMLTAGNHDSVQRLSFAAPLLSQQGVHISQPLSESSELVHVTLCDEYGPVTFWLMPYVFPAMIAHVLGEDCPRDNDGAVRALLAGQPIDFSQRNVLVAHQFVTAGGAEAIRGGSESMIGGIGQIDYTAFDGFDYAALGHIHAAYPVGRETVRYAGSPLCYHFDETRQPPKGPVMVDIGAKGEAITIETLHIPPLHTMREMKGSFEQLRAEAIADTRRGEYLRVILTDRRVTQEVASFFRDLCESRGSVLMEITSEYYTYSDVKGPERSAVERKSVEELFTDFFADRMGGALPTETEAALIAYAGELLLGGMPPEKQIERLLAFAQEQEGEA